MLHVGIFGMFMLIRTCDRETLFQDITNETDLISGYLYVCSMYIIMRIVFKGYFERFRKNFVILLCRIDE